MGAGPELDALRGQVQQLGIASAVDFLCVVDHGRSLAQRRHLAELRRVLRPDGVGYLAVPNRWQMVEPHYRLAFLSWLPQAWRTPYLRLRHRGSHYDCRPLTVPQVEGLLAEAGFSFVQQHGRALRLTFELERPLALIYRAAFKWLPDSLYAMLRRAFPTLIFTMTPAASGPGEIPLSGCASNRSRRSRRAG